VFTHERTERSGLCSSDQLGAFITTLPSGTSLNDTSIFTSGLRFDSPSFPSDTGSIGGDNSDYPTTTSTASGELGSGIAEDITDPYGGDYTQGETDEEIAEEEIAEEEAFEEAIDVEIHEIEAEAEAQEEADEEAADGYVSDWKVRHSGRGLSKRRWDDITGSVIDGVGAGSAKAADGQYEDEIGRGYGDEVGGGFGDTIDEGLGDEIGGGFGDAVDGGYGEEIGGVYDDAGGEVGGGLGDIYDEEPTTGSDSTSGSSAGVVTYSAPITYAVPKTGYYCVGERLSYIRHSFNADQTGIVPVTLVNSRAEGSDMALARRQATHAEYAGSVLFRNVFDGELPAVEYPKINVSFFHSDLQCLLTNESSTSL